MRADATGAAQPTRAIRRAYRQVRKAVKLAILRRRFPAALDDNAAARFLDALAEEISGRSVALVGNAQSIFEQPHGAAIEAHDFVMRLNYGAVHSPEHQGRRTDILGFSCAISRARARRNFGEARLVWLTRQRHNIAPSFMADRRNLWFCPSADVQALALELDGRFPSSGLIAADLLLNRLAASRVTLFGFDWKRTPTFYQTTPARDAHDWRAEARLLRNWARHSDGRLCIVDRPAEPIDRPPRLRSHV